MELVTNWRALDGSRGAHGPKKFMCHIKNNKIISTGREQLAELRRASQQAETRTSRRHFVSQLPNERLKSKKVTYK
jgi:hypothetical protein